MEDEELYTFLSKKKIDFNGHTMSDKHVIDRLYPSIGLGLCLEQYNPKKGQSIEEQLTDENLNHVLEERFMTDITCHHCAESVKFRFENGAIVAKNRCKFPGGHPEIVAHLKVPSGEILFLNDFRDVYITDIQYDVNTIAGIAAQTACYEKLGMIAHFVGNTCPDIYLGKNGSIKIGSGIRGTNLGDICTDWWWYSAADKDDFERVSGGTVEQYQKENSRIVRVKVLPGLYKTTGRYHLVDPNKNHVVYSVISRIGSL